MPCAQDKRTQALSRESGAESCTGNLEVQLVLKTELAPLSRQQPSEGQAAVRYKCFDVPVQAMSSLAPVSCLGFTLC